MIRVDFYIIKTPSTSLLSIVYKLVAKAYASKQRLYIHAESLEQAKQLDEFLWTWREGDFIPHQLWDNQPSPHCPIYIGADDSITIQSDILLNLHATIPSFHTGFNRIIEVVADIEPQRSESRKKYVFYREQNYQLHTHAL